ncbi:serine hydrolase [Dyadobacter arcticus]|uniref:CubicO group peptidase (Beta-lactamase class C family) n=1 Tax=Dyadobacter arcticus TaxID=1078754 RepID=A0ABX0UJ51_9BACT|nr:serine hydrolase [Dyadobacter arcticus]NIJ52822.1 CubicO group peptidase (beta-lactamase class C family) [Dyadobacter arcticus]
MKSPSPKLIFAFFLLLTSSSIRGQSPVPAAKIDSIFAEWNKPGVPGAAVGVVHGGKLIYAKGFGEADLETGAKIGPETIFHVASVSKQFTDYAIVMLAEQGKLSLDDDIRKYIPEIYDFGKTITIRNLANHTSGLRDQWNLLAMAGWQLDDVITKQHVFNIITRQRELNFEPGSAYAYCNTGYTILAEIVSRITKQPFDYWMERNVFKPLGMKNTLFYDNQEKIVKGRAYSFHRTPGTFGPTMFSKSILSYGNVGATSLFTTVNDLALWIDNFRSPQVGTKATMKQMLEKGRLTKGDTLPYALGLAHGKYKGLDFYGHGGADAGFRSNIAYFPKEDYGFIVLSNQAEFDPGKKSFEMADLYLSKYIKEQKPVTKPANASSGEFKFDSTHFKNYVGSYSLTEAPGFVMTFKKEGDKFMTQATGQPWFEVFPSSDSTFFLKVVEASVIFHKPKEGKVTRITLLQNGEHPATRVESQPDTSTPKEQLVGSYYSPELETLYTIALKDDTLKLRHVHHGEVNLIVTGKDKLQAPWWFVQTIDMLRDASGHVNGLKMTNGRVMNLRFKKLADDFAAGALSATVK